MIKKISTLVFFGFLMLLLSAAMLRDRPKLETRKGSQYWVDSVFSSLKEDEKIGQLFMVAAFSNKGPEHEKEIEELITQNHIGGLIFFQGGPLRQARLTNRYQSLSKVPLFLAMDAEWGLGMRLDSTISFPRQMTLGAIQNNKLIYNMGKEIARQCTRIGMHINFAPVIDINFNPANPVIGTRAFGENIYNVTEKGTAYMKGMQHQHVLACGKHFPGHGDTDTDSHKTLPIIKHSKERIESVELFPFRELMKDSLASVMVAHLNIPSLDSTPNLPTTLSSKVVNKLLKQKMKFQGLVFTDALNMKGISNYSEPGDVDAQALIAGNDVLLYPEDVPKAVTKIKEAIARHDISQREVDHRIKKILLYKYWARLHLIKPIQTKSLYEDLNNEKAQALNYTLFQNAMTVVKNDNALIPVKHLDNNTFASVMLGDTKNNEFTKKLNKYADIENHFVPTEKMTTYSLDAVYEKVKDKKIVIVGLGTMNNSRSKRNGIHKEQVDFLNKLNKTTKVIVVAFGNPYGLRFLDNLPNIICTYQRNDMTEIIAPQLIFGAIGADGRLPVTASKNLTEGTGIRTESLGRTGFSYPSLHRMDLKKLEEIDEIVQEALDMKATPGCQVLVAREGKVVYHKNYGYLDYEETSKVGDSTVYDIASITKVVASTQALMWLRNNNLIHPDDTIASYLPELHGTNKEFMTFREVLSHQAGLISFIGYYIHTLDSLTKEPTSFYFNDSLTDEYSLLVSDSLYVKPMVWDSVWKWTIESRLTTFDKEKNTFKYRYSDVGYYMMKKVTEEITHQPFNEFLEQNFYKPLGMTLTGYNPKFWDDTVQIAPTEDDYYFRNQIIRGTVHDQGAALIGGVGGHAGIFSTAEDLLKMAQMNLQQGYYGGIRYFSEDVLYEFTRQQFEDNRKGMGWDKMRPEGGGATSEYSSFNTFGHTGFTGTGMWIDPEYDLIYVFLSNRVYPKASNNKLLKYDIRTRIHDVIYESMVTYDSQEMVKHH